MIARAALAALAAAIEQGGDVDAAYLALGRADPLIRGPARRRVRAAWADACLATRVKHGEEGERHALRVAYLLLARAPPSAATIDDTAAVEAAFERARLPRAGGFWWATALALLALLAAGGAGAFLVIRELYVPPLPPLVATTARGARPPRGVYETGGVPVPGPGDTAIRRALGADVPDFLIALDRWSSARQAGDGTAAAREAEMGEALGRALGPRARAALGESAANALAGLLGAARAAAEAPPGEAAERAGDALLEATGAFDDELAAEGLGYFVDGDVITDGASGKRLVLLYSFEVERARIFASGGATVRALHLRRIDALNWTHALLGFTRPNLRAALVLRRQLDEQVLDLIGPGLAPGAAVTLFDPEAGPEVAEARARVEARAGELVRAEYGALPGIDAGAGKLGELLGRRRALLESWKAKVRRSRARAGVAAHPAPARRLRAVGGGVRAARGDHRAPGRRRGARRGGAGPHVRGARRRARHLGGAARGAAPPRRRRAQGHARAARAARGPARGGRPRAQARRDRPRRAQRLPGRARPRRPDGGRGADADRALPLRSAACTGPRSRTRRSSSSRGWRRISAARRGGRCWRRARSTAARWRRSTWPSRPGRATGCGTRRGGSGRSSSRRRCRSSG